MKGINFSKHTTLLHLLQEIEQLYLDHKCPLERAQLLQKREELEQLYYQYQKSLLDLEKLIFHYEEKALLLRKVCVSKPIQNMRKSNFDVEEHQILINLMNIQLKK